jgi:hypothetical protein
MGLQGKALIQLQFGAFGWISNEKRASSLEGAMSITALATSLLPARHAASIDPIQTLRSK